MDNYKKELEYRMIDFGKKSYFSEESRKKRQFNLPMLFKSQVNEYMFSHLLMSNGVMDVANLKVLDCGCGDGQTLRKFIDLGADPENLTGIDVNQESIDLAKKLSSPYINFLVSHADELKFPDESFDLILLNGVLQLITTDNLRKNITNELQRVLMKKGFIIVTDVIYQVNYKDENLVHSPINQDLLSAYFQNCSINHYQPYWLSDEYLYSHEFRDWGDGFRAAINPYKKSHKYAICLLQKK